MHKDSSICTVLKNSFLKGVVLILLSIFFLLYSQKPVLALTPAERAALDNQLDALYEQIVALDSQLDERFRNRGGENPNEDFALNVAYNDLVRAFFAIRFQLDPSWSPPQLDSSTFIFDHLRDEGTMYILYSNGPSQTIVVQNVDPEAALMQVAEQIGTPFTELRSRTAVSELNGDVVTDAVVTLERDYDLSANWTYADERSLSAVESPQLIRRIASSLRISVETAEDYLRSFKRNLVNEQFNTASRKISDLTGYRYEEVRRVTDYRVLYRERDEEDEGDGHGGDPGG